MRSICKCLVSCDFAEMRWLTRSNADSTRRKWALTAGGILEIHEKRSGASAWKGEGASIYETFVRARAFWRLGAGCSATILSLHFASGGVGERKRFWNTQV